ncbi:MAG: DNA translocase FtsK [Alkalibacterium sp.]|nr:DNA translocase FtsK [Alkalibacterium sp.]
MIITLVFFGIMTFFQFSYRELFDRIRNVLKAILSWIGIKFKQLKSNRAEKVKARKAKPKKNAKNAKNTKATETVSANDKINEETGAPQQDTESEQTALEIEGYQELQAKYNQKVQNADKAEQSDKAEDTETSDEDGPVEFEIGEEENQSYRLPPVTLLDEHEAVDQSDEYTIIQKNVKKLEETFESFGVKAKVTKANLGPAVTKYEIQPATGVKVSKIVSLTDDLALALAAKDIRMEAPIPGKAVIGIEVPNSEVSTVSFRELRSEGQTKKIKTSCWKSRFGRRFTGNVAMADLSETPPCL